MKSYPELNDKLIAFIQKQKMFFVATAPLTKDGHVNVSPKGYDSFKIIDNNTVAYLDKANIMRLYGQGSVCAFHDDGFAEKLAWFPDFDRARAIITINLTRVMDSCGYGVPFYDFVGARDQLKRSHEFKSVEDWHEYRYDKNPESLDGLPGLVRPKGKA